ncbi:hypothetical protein BDV95DRAFT_538912 [Massariosphaeria phaeospora]|uniref:SAP domain-containing protein n=1 Tax=Massariosphaeria phaeospora TaxID=100035 RepID=A0A7C8IBC2_9PLEO|nr:hypothetical protein BDV95DRAFT_538912 [Massariosphaeria phaeospora]
MSDYNKQTVANLRQVLKDRAIPSTGLTRKAQIIEKLAEWDKAQASNGASAEPGIGAEAQAAQPEEPAAGDEAQAVANEAPPAATADTVVVVKDVVEITTTETSEPQLVEEVTAPTALSAPTNAQGETAPTTDSIAAEQPAETLATSMIATETSEPQHAEETATSSAALDAPEISEPAPEIPAPQTQPETQEMDVERNRTPSPSPNEKRSIEGPEPTLVPERSTHVMAEDSRVNTEELEADSKKRKRRSHSPEVRSKDIRAKKPRPSEDAAPEVHLAEDNDVVMEEPRPETEESSAADEPMMGDLNGVTDEGPKQDAEQDAKPPTPELESKPSAPEKKEKAPRYKALFETAAPTTIAEAISDDRPISPALHPATPAIYIRNLMRPLRPDPLRTHLVSLASPPSGPPDTTIIKALFLDGMKTHALVLFANTTAASRVRASLHGSIWPPENNRKELWVDFVPEDDVESWIQQEEDAITAEKEARGAGRPISSKRYEVVYPETEDGVKAILQEVGSRASNAPFNAPKGPRSNIEVTRGSHQAPLRTPTAPNAETKQDAEKSFQTLDSLFESTTAKPKVYYLPLSNAIADARLDELNRETSRDWRPEDKVRGRGGGQLDQKARYGFDEEDRVLEVGPDHGPWANDSGGFRGGRGGFRGGGGGGGGYRGRARGPWRG